MKKYMEYADKCGVIASVDKPTEQCDQAQTDYGPAKKKKG